MALDVAAWEEFRLSSVGSGGRSGASSCQCHGRKDWKEVKRNFGPTRCNWAGALV